MRQIFHGAVGPTRAPNFSIFGQEKGFWRIFPKVSRTSSLSSQGSAVESNHCLVGMSRFGRVEVWRGSFRFEHICRRAFRLAVPYWLDHGAVFTPTGSTETREAAGACSAVNQLPKSVVR
jgi:hypothetical protein